jgi:hypothetical protein
MYIYDIISYMVLRFIILRSINKEPQERWLCHVKHFHHSPSARGRQPNLSCHRKENMGKNQHVTPSPTGGWQVIGAGNSKATVKTETQGEAIKIGRTIAQNQESELVIHGQNGQIRDSDSYGPDPCPPKDKKH